ncbi:hypothetical protein MMC18_006748 [Xylographa bjoerkii]|nr:hypothetical protein [Xylographa bjoerkii]
MPLYTLMIASRMTWFITILMWLTAPLSVPLGFIFRWCKILGKRKEEWRSDGILGSEELAEFVRLHQIDAGLGGKLGNKVGEWVRFIIKGEVGAVGEIAGWDRLFKVHEDQRVDAALLACNVWGNNVNDQVFIRDLPIHSIPIVRQNCNLMALEDWLLGDYKRVVIVVHSNDIINCDANGLSWSPGGSYGDPPMGLVTSTPISPLGFITSHCFLRRLFLGVNDTWKAAQTKQTSWTESTDNNIGPDRSFTVPTHGNTSLTELFPAHGLRKRSNTLKNTSDENTERLYNAAAPKSTHAHDPYPLEHGQFNGLDEDECVLSPPDSVGSLVLRFVPSLSSIPPDVTRPVQPSPLANVTNSKICPKTDTSSSCYSSTHDKTSFHSNLEQPWISETQRHSCDNRRIACYEHFEHTSSRRQSLPSQRPSTLDTDAAYCMSCGLPPFRMRTSEQIRGVRMSSSRSTSAAHGEDRCIRLGPLSMEQVTPPIRRVEQRHKIVTDPEDDGRVNQRIQAIQGKCKVKEKLTSKTEKRHESLTEPQEDEDINNISSA